MNDDRKSKSQLIDELNSLRRELSLYKEKYPEGNPIGAAKPNNGAGNGHESEYLQDEHRVLKCIMSTSPAPIVLVDRSGQIAFANPAAEKIFGLKKDEITSRTYKDPTWRITDHNGRPSPADALPFSITRRTGKPVYGVEHAVHSPTGKKALLSINAAPVFDGDGSFDGMVAVMEDITGRKSVEEKLKESEKRYRTIIEQMPVVCFSFDREGRILSWNKGAENVYGYSSEEAIGTSAYDLMVTPQTLGPTKEVIKTVFEGRSIKDSIWQDKNRMGETGWRVGNAFPIFDKNGNVKYGVNINVDISGLVQAEEALREREEQFRALVENSSDVIMRFDREYRHLYVSPAVKNVVDIEPEEFTGKTHRDLGFPPGICEFWEDSIERVFESGEACETEFTMEGKSGEIVLNWRLFPELDRKGRVKTVMSVSRDITDQKQAEESLRKSEERFRAMAELLPQTIFESDTEVNLTFVNQAAFKQFGYSLQDFERGLNGIEMFIPADRQRARQNVAKRFRGEAVGLHEYTALRKDGSTFPVILQANPIYKNDKPAGLMGFIIDISEHKLAERKVEQSRTLLRSVMDLVPAYICAKNLDGRFVLVNKRLADFYGSTVDEMTGALHADLCEDEKELEAMLAADRKVIESGQPQFIAEETMKNPDGSITVLETTKIPFDAFGEPAVLIAARDITERWLLEEERAKSGKLESIGILAGGIAHDFNNILTAIFGNLSLAKITAAEEGSKIGEALTNAENAAFSARNLTQQLLTFAKGGEPVKKMASLKELIEETAGFALRGSNVKCAQHITQDLWPCEIDQGQISQVIHNLVINADQAMPEGGTIFIYAENANIGEQDHLPLEEGKYVKLTIRDQGLGISEEHLSKLFDPYFTTKQKGSGLGLATAYSVVKRHSGHITVESELKVGTSFHIYLPASSKPIETKQAKRKSAAVPESKILVMDDDQAVRDVVAWMLERLKHEVKTASDGEEAVELYRRAMDGGDPFDAVILDLTVPGGMGGKKTIKRLRAIDPDVRAIVSSGYSDDPVVANFKDYGFSGVVSKPYRIDQMQEVLSDLLRFG